MARENAIVEDELVAEAGGLERRTVYYSGKVQGVGFRYETRFLAQQFKVNGYVQNLDDGRVLLIVEGAKNEIDKFLAWIGEAMGQHIRNVTQTSAQAIGEFNDFRIER